VEESSPFLVKSPKPGLPVALNPRRRDVRPAQTPLGQLKREEYNPASAARPSIDLVLKRAVADLPVHEQFTTKAGKETQDILKSLAQAMRMPDASQWAAPGASLSPGMKGGGNEFNKLIGAIRGKESGGNYGAVNRHSGAMGAYQIMPGNLGPWSREILGRTVSRSEFMNNPSIQDQIAQGKLYQYYQKYGAAGASVAWYAGPGAVSSKMGSTRKQGQYPSINDYMRDIMSRL
jgi:hypothetical protein